MSFGHRLLLSLPRFKHDPDKAPLGTGLRSAFLKPVDPTPPQKPGPRPKSRRRSRKSSTLPSTPTTRNASSGYCWRRLAAAIGIAVVNDLIAHDPAVGRSTSTT